MNALVWSFLTKLSKYWWIKTGDRHYHFVEPWVIDRPFCRMEIVYQSHFVETGVGSLQNGAPQPPAGNGKEDDVSMYLTTLHDDQNKVETFWFWKVLLHDCSMWPLPNLTVSKMSDFRFFHFGSDAKRFGRLCHMSVKLACIIGKSQTFLQALPHECETSVYNGEMAGPYTVNVWRMNSCLYTQLR